MINAFVRQLGNQPDKGHGPAILHASFRNHPEDFKVTELLGFELPEVDAHSAEFQWLNVEKCSMNTEFVAETLARHGNLPRRSVSYSGRKDRHAVARQWFSVHLTRPGKPRAVIDWRTVSSPHGGTLRVLDVRAATRKLRVGTHRENHFRIVLRDVRGSSADEAFENSLNNRLETIRRSGFPARIGEQRLGHEGRNLQHANRLFNGTKLTRNQRSLALSAARAELFNAVLDHRINQGNWQQPLPGEPIMLRATQSWFSPTEFNSVELLQRLDVGDVSTSGPWWGEGKALAQDTCAQMEATCLDSDSLTMLAAGLSRQRLKQQRRALIGRADDLTWNYCAGSGMLILDFTLDRGIFATSLLECLGAMNRNLLPTHLDCE